MKRPLRVGLFGIGLDAYWPRFKGLRPRLAGYLRLVRDRLKRPGVEVAAWIEAARVAHVLFHNRLAALRREVNARQIQSRSVEMSVKRGPVTLLSVVQTVDGRLKLLVAEGESVPGPILEIGNPNSRYRFSLGARRFVNEWIVHGPTHHCAVGLGHIAGKIDKLGNLLQIETNQVC
jgi:L-arabinose isomerase